MNCSTAFQNWLNYRRQYISASEVPIVPGLIEEEDDICGLCGEPGADKMKRPVHWPGEQNPDGPWVHEECEREECKRAHAALSREQRERFLRSIW